MRPFLRWAGGKRWLTAQRTLVLNAGERLVEPFVGGGALFFASQVTSALLADTNRCLINTYNWMKINYTTLYKLLMENFDKHSEVYYYEVRLRLGDETVQDAADFIYLNRACFNGVFRVNLAGRFNVPIGNKLYEIRDEEEYKNWARHLKMAELVVADFEEVIDRCSENDLIFADPPYTVNHNENGFIAYNEKIFSWDDQVRLHDCLVRAAARGAKFALTNADHISVRELYRDFDITTTERGSEMAGAKGARGRTTEVIVTSS